MGVSLKKLIDIAGASLSPPAPMVELPRSIPKEFREDLFEMLSMKNGFYAFEQSLWVRPLRGRGMVADLNAWNDHNLWISAYDGLASGLFFFAEDVFGNQFGAKAEGIYSFDSETGDVTFIAQDLEGWSKLILQDYNVLTGYPLAHSWQMANGRLDPGRRLIPKVPFVLSGEFSVENLFDFPDVSGMKLKANLATQIRDLPDGAQIVWNIVD